MLDTLMWLAIALAGTGPTAEAAVAEAPTGQSQAPREESASATAVLAPAVVRLQALTPIEIEVLEEVSSKTAVRGMPVRLALAQPLYVNGDMGIPQGTAVEGVVIHAAKGGMGGKSGELVIGARLIRLQDGLTVPLRSFKLGPAKGRNNETIAFATAVTVGLPALLINGGSARIPAGSIAHAKTSSDVDIPIALLTRMPPATAAGPGDGRAPSAPPLATQTNSTGDSK